MPAHKSGIYLVTFTMLAPINSMTGWGSKKMTRAFMVTSSFAKIGKFEGGVESRQADYRKTYGDYFHFDVLWSGDLSKADVRRLESLIKKKLSPHRCRNPLTGRQTEYVDLAQIDLGELRRQVMLVVEEFLGLVV